MTIASQMDTDASLWDVQNQGILAGIVCALNGEQCVWTIEPVEKATNVSPHALAKTFLGARVEFQSAGKMFPWCLLVCRRMKVNVVLQAWY